MFQRSFSSTSFSFDFIFISPILLCPQLRVVKLISCLTKAASYAPSSMDVVESNCGTMSTSSSSSTVVAPYYSHVFKYGLGEVWIYCIHDISMQLYHDVVQLTKKNTFIETALTVTLPASSSMSATNSSLNKDTSIHKNTHSRSNPRTHQQSHHPSAETHQLQAQREILQYSCDSFIFMSKHHFNEWIELCSDHNHLSSLILSCLYTWSIYHTLLKAQRRFKKKEYDLLSLCSIRHIKKLCFSMLQLVLTNYEDGRLQHIIFGHTDNDQGTAESEVLFQGAAGHTSDQGHQQDRRKSTSSIHIYPRVYLLQKFIEKTLLPLLVVHIYPSLQENLAALMLSEEDKSDLEDSKKQSIEWVNTLIQSMRHIWRNINMAPLVSYKAASHNQDGHPNSEPMKSNEVPMGDNTLITQLCSITTQLLEITSVIISNKLIADHEQCNYIEVRPNS